MKIVLVLGIIFAVVIAVVFIAMSMTVNNVQNNDGIASGGNYDAKSFFRNGGRGWLSITPYYNEINATIGSSVQLPVTLTHIASKDDPLTIVSVRYVGMQSHIIPFCTSAILQIPSEVISFDSDTKQSNDVSLIAGESKGIILNMTIPQDWPKCVNSTILWHLKFVDLDNLDPKDFLMDNTYVPIRVVG